MSRATQLVIILLVAAAASRVGWADECEFSAERQAQIDAADARRVEIRARAGSLRIEGRQGGAVDASGMACASSETVLQGIQIQTRREGEALYVDVLVPDRESMDSAGLFGSTYASLNLTVLLPDALPIVVVDSSGEAEISRVAAADVTDSSGDLRIRDVPGDVRVRDSSGELQLRNIGGNLHLIDSSGDVRVSAVRGGVDVEVDSSGDLEIEGVGRDVHIQQDSSGGILIADVQGGVRIDHDGSGDVDVRRVKGGFTLGSKGSGDVRHDEIGGQVDADR